MSGIWNALGLPRSSVFNLLEALEETGLVERNSETGKYRLGLRLLVLAGAVQSRLDVRQVALAELRRLTEETQETSHLGVLELRDLEVVYIEKLDSPQTIKLASYVGRKVPSYCTSLGKVLLAGLPDSVLRERLAGFKFQALTPNTVTSLDKLMAVLAAVRQQGYAVDDEEHEPGVRCVAAPVRGADGGVAAAVSVAGPASRMTRERVHAMAPRVVAAANAIAARLGYRGPESFSILEPKG